MKIKTTAARLIKAVVAVFNSGRAAFCNIAEGTHSGSITMIAAEAVDSANLVVKAGANAGDKPLGICSDEGAKNERLAVILPASAESTIICRAAGDISAGASVYTSANGKVSATPANGSYKIGVAVCSSNTGGVVEVDPQGFGESAWQFYACGIHTWDNATNSGTIPCSGLSADDVVVAAIQTAGGSEKSVKAAASSTGITFTLDANGTSGSTKISWIAIRKN